MSFTYNLATDIGKLRLLLPDREQQEMVFHDAEWQAFLDIEGANLRRALVRALRTVATDPAAAKRVVRRWGLDENAGDPTALLLRRANDELKEATDTEAAAVGGAFDWAEMVLDDFSYRERLTAEWLRSVP